jgi:hypothetical protein
MHGSRIKIHSKNLVRKRWAEGFNSGFRRVKLLRYVIVTVIRCCSYYLFIIFSGSAAERGLWPSHSRGFLITHIDAPHSVGLLWTSDQLDAKTSTWEQTTHTTDKLPCPRWDSNPRSQQASGRRILCCILEEQLIGLRLQQKWRRKFLETYPLRFGVCPYTYVPRLPLEWNYSKQKTRNKMKQGESSTLDH